MTAPPTEIAPDRLESATRTAIDRLLAERVPAGHWVGELSTSALSTAVAAMALHQFHTATNRDRQGAGSRDAPTRVAAAQDRLPDGRGSSALIEGAVAWLLAHPNADGGWGDTIGSKSNVSTTALCVATLTACVVPEGEGERHTAVLAAGRRWFEEAGGFDAVVARYGKDETFSVPILTHCALAGLVPWDRVTALPFELATLPPRFYAAVRLPVVSYALPALIAIGQLRHAKRPSRNPVLRGLRAAAVGPTLRRLASIQPSNGGFLEAAPLTGFVLMSLSAAGRADHPVAKKCAAFLTGGVRDDGSWPIDTNLATWCTTLAVNALGEDLPEEDRPPVRDWLLAQQFREVHPYTRAAPGGWAWTDAPGGVPDADDTPGAILALQTLGEPEARASAVSRHDGDRTPEARASGSPADATRAGVRWLLGLQNRDGGVPTFCRGWGALPFDRSAPDLTAHAVRAWVRALRSGTIPAEEVDRGLVALSEASHYLEFHSRRTDDPGRSWLPLWFGNQHAPGDENPVYGTARVMAACLDGGTAANMADDAATFLLWAQNDDGGWGGTRGCPSSVEETALAAEVLVRHLPDHPEPWRGVAWLVDRVEDGTWTTPAPIGFYFAKLWYHERLYPQIFTVAALRAARAALRGRAAAGETAAPAAATG